MRGATFTPTVTIDETGRIEIDWSGSLSNVWDTDIAVIDDDALGDRLSEQLDTILGLTGKRAPSPAKMLRRLARHIARQS